MNYKEMYNSKMCSPEAAVSVIKSGDRVFTGGNPGLLLQAFFENKNNYQNVELYSQFGMMGPLGEMLFAPDMQGKISFACTTLALSSVMNTWPQENLDQISLSFSGMERLIETRIKPDVVLLSGCTMDDEGYINLGCNHGCTRTAIDMGAKVLLQIKDEMYNATTDYYHVHISEVDAIVKDNKPPEGPPGGASPRAVDEKDAQLASHVVERIPNGATIQLGAGGASNAIGTFLKDHRDLGVHAETIMESQIQLMEDGVINNSRKPVLRGKTVVGFITGGVRIQKHLHNNPDVILKKLSWVNDPMVISQIPNLVSVNSCLAVDLRGQVCAESLAMGNTGGIGGQLDFVEGARKSAGGQSYLIMHASVTTRSGEKVSKITLSLPAGSVVTTPASEVMNIATDYGVAELWHKSAKERAENLIRVADPEFRDSLRFEAKKAGLL